MVLEFLTEDFAGNLDKTEVACMTVHRVECGFIVEGWNDGATRGEDKWFATLPEVADYIARSC